MAYIRDPKEDEQNGQNLTTSGQSSVVTGSEGVADPNASAAQGTSWTNLSKYLNANEGLGGGIADTVTAGTQGKVDSAAGKINEYQTKAASANSAGAAQNSKLDGYKSAINSNPTKVDANAFKNDTTAGYQGMTDASKADGYSDAYSAYGSAKDDYNNLKTNDWNSRQSVIQNTYGKDNAAYTKGMGLLDTLVLQGDAKGQDGINNFVSKNQSFIGDDNTNALTSAKGSVQSAYDAEKSRWDTLLGTGDGSLNQTLSAKKTGLTSALDSRTGQVAAKNSALNEKEDVLRAVAAKAAKSASLAYDPTTYLSRKDYGLGDVVSDAERAEIEALNNLGDYNSVIDSGKYKAGTGQGVTVSDAAIKAGLGFDYSAENNRLNALRNDGSFGKEVTNDQYYADILKDTFKSKGYK